MKSRLQALIRAASNSDLYQAILRSLTTGIETNSDLEQAIGNVLPFLSDGDRNMRAQAIKVLAYYNTNFRSPVVQKHLAEMAEVKLPDSACLEPACEIVSLNLKQLDVTQLATIFSALISTRLRPCPLSARLAAYNLLKDLSDREFPIADPPAAVTQLKDFCGFEQDPRCLSVVFRVFPKLAIRLLSQPDRAELFDIIGVFFPITSHTDLRAEHCSALAAIPDFADDLATLVTVKLKNSLADTRPAVYSSLPTLLVHPTSKELVGDLIIAFIESLAQHFAQPASCEEAVVDAAVRAISGFVGFNESSWPLVRGLCTSEFVPKLLESHEAETIRAHSIVLWLLDGFLHFSGDVLDVLAAAAQATDDLARLQSILASVIEFLKLQQGRIQTDLSRFLRVALRVLPNDNANLQISALVTIRELSKHAILPVDADLIPTLIRCLPVGHFTAQCLLALSDQEQYSGLLEEQFVRPFVDAFFRDESSALFGGAREMATFAASLVGSPIFTRPILVSAAKSGAHDELLRIVVHLETIDDATSRAVVDALDDRAPRDLLFAVGMRSSHAFVAGEFSGRFGNWFLAVAAPDWVAADVDNLDDEGVFWMSTKVRVFPEGFRPHPVGMAIRGVFGEGFTADAIPALLEFENTFDKVLWAAADKFEFLQSRFVYHLDYKKELWRIWSGRLDDDPANLLKLCLLCPPDYFMSKVGHLVAFFPRFLAVDVRGSLDLLIFALISCTRESHPEVADRKSAASAQKERCGSLCRLFNPAPLRESR
jgi:hypothetical protein